MKKRFILLCLGILLCALAFWTLWSNYAVTTTYYQIVSPNLPQAYSGLRIAQISDFHNADLGENSGRLIEALKEAAPDIIVVTGDLVDSYHPEPQVSIDLMRQVATIAPTYYVTGNHEARLPVIYGQLKSDMIAAGITVLEGSSVILERNGQAIRITGIHDPAFFGGNPEDSIQEALEAVPQDDIYTILLAHRPELFSYYCNTDADLVFSGHAHGGQLRLPFIGAIFAPGQGLFPKMADGVHSQSNTTIVVSRGLGSSSIPIRFCNPPELVVVDLVSS